MTTFLLGVIATILIGYVINEIIGRQLGKLEYNQRLLKVDIDRLTQVTAEAHEQSGRNSLDIRVLEQRFTDDNKPKGRSGIASVNNEAKTPFWNDAPAIKTALQTVTETSDIPDVEELQGLTPNEAFHALADRHDELMNG